MEKPILIMGSDDHARAVEAYMIGAGHPVHRFSSTDSLSVCGDDEHFALKLPNGFLCDEMSVKCMYWRTYDGVEHHDEHVVTHNRRSIFESWLKHMDSASTCWNGWNAWSMHQTKPYQHMAMCDIHGLRVSQVVPSIYGKTQQDLYACRKCVQGGMMAAGPGEWLRTDAPYLHQDVVKGMTFRVFMIGDDISDYVAYHIQTPKFDYRDDPRVVITREEIFQDVLLDIQDMLCWLGWMWAGIDVIYSEGIWHILDVNPSPMFLGWDSEQPVLKTLCECLMR